MESDRKRLEQFFEKRLEGYLTELRRMVAVNSFTRNAAGVNLLGEQTTELFSRLGFAAERIPSANLAFGDHFLLSRPGSSAIQIGLVSHLDTVFPPEEEFANNFCWREDSERIYGPGTVDIKGGTLLIYMMLEALQNFFPNAFERVNWLILLDASEETLSDDFGELCRERLKGAKACLVFEAGHFQDGMFRLVTSRKGMAKYRLTAEGKGAHAGTSHPDGANAIVQLAQAVDEIHRFTDYDRDLTFNIGYFNGGTVANRVPHFAEAYGEMRSYSKSIFDEGVARLLSLDNLSTIGNGDGYRCLVRVMIFNTTRPWPKNEATENLFQLWADLGRELGWRLEPEARGGLSDGNHTWEDIPTLDGLGAGGGNAHCSEHLPSVGKEQEYLSLPSLIPKSILNTLAVVRLIDQAG